MPSGCLDLRSLLWRIPPGVCGVALRPLCPETGHSRRENFCQRTSGVGRVKPVACDFPTSAERSSAATGRVQFYARTRP